MPRSDHNSLTPSWGDGADSSRGTAAKRSTPKRWAALIDDVGRAAVLRSINRSRDLVKLGRFEGIKWLGRGGYGDVFEVRDPVFDRHVALKLCLTSGPEAAAALIDEAKVLARLSHPNIVTVLEPGFHEQEVFFVMELLEGGDGSQLITEEPSASWEHIVDVYRKAGRGLAAAHDAGIIHGDFKPTNILLDSSDRPRLSDFGLARVMRDYQPDPEPGSPRRYYGTDLYMAPEQLGGAPGDARSDQWSFCVALWETLEGCLPFRAETPEDMLVAVMLDEPRVGDRDVPERVRDVLRVGLSVDPNQRYSSMHVLLAELDGLLEPEFDAVVELPTDELARRRWKKGGITAVVLATGLGLVGEAYLLGKQEARAESVSLEHRAPPERSNVENITQCVADGAPFEPDASMRAICRMLGTDGIEAAGDLWIEIAESRAHKAGTDDLVKLASDTLVLAQTFLYEADTADLERATQLREAASGLACDAEAYLSKVTGGETDETAGAVSQSSDETAPTCDESDAPISQSKVASDEIAAAVLQVQWMISEVSAN